MTGKPESAAPANAAPDSGPETAPAPAVAGRVQQSAAALIILAVACWVAIVSFDVEDPQPYLFPQLLSGFMVALSLMALLRALRGKNRTGAGIGGGQFLNIAAGLAVMLVYVFALADWLGFYSAAFLAMLTLYSLYDPQPHDRVRTWAVRLAVTAGFVAVIYAVFALGLKVQTPEGILF
ncbi:MAG: tripartite tricarboxylate transporter TctB family protein [Rhodospirillaceae bacterium]|nr:tripartite tricarboxylate transporter TctB family protein [Rhodospirillaceae bacterium]MYH36614.1 tripartite tricarboxylate transporter TctB family protein [Rhodospirillaceae bacterium]MYK13480.1 tripartite tricarboxylate transporter TctB family protein [Rhodospirillaceae bacterium]MYK57214.1 tripartite tricarboxylate transporter TctB family protein [Rhodospirillaceae bacterium]